MELQAEITNKTLRKSRFAPTIELATNDEGSEIGILVSSNGFNIDLDWSEVYPYWIVAKTDKIVGCLQVLPGKPVGRLEMLATSKDLSDFERAQTAWRLIVSGITTLKMAGSELASAVIPFEAKRYKKLLKKRGAITVGQGNIMVMKV